MDESTTTGGKAGATSGTADSEAAAGGTGAGGRLGKAKEYVSEKYDSAAETVKNRYTAVRGKVEEIDMGEVTEKVRGYVRANPGKAMLISVGVGFVIGLLLRRGSDED